MPIMNVQRDIFPVTVPLTQANHRVAQEFYRHHPDSQKAKRVYLNTLSVQAVTFYMTCLGYETDLDQSASWDPALQVLSETADLWINGIGRLECRPVLPMMKSCWVPSQVRSDRIGYVAVSLNPELTEAELLGFVPTVQSDYVSLDKLQPLDDLPHYLHHLALTQRPSISARLSDWLQNALEVGWENLDTLMSDRQFLEPALSFRGALNAQPTDAALEKIRRGKFLALGTPDEEHVLFVLGVAPTLVSPDYQITVEVYPTGGHPYLPQSLQLAVTDDTGKTVLQAEGSNSEGLEFQFSGELGERFSVRVSLSEVDIVETFEI